MTGHLLRWFAAASLFLLVFGFKLDVVRRFGSDLPRWDALDAEGLAVYLPLAEGKLAFTDLFRPHNEHRIFWTKLLGLAELTLNGQWDSRLQCTVNAALHSLIAVAWFVFARSGLPRRFHAPAFGLVALLIGLPLAWENPIAGFHSQQYFLLGFSFGAIALLPAAAPWTPRWWTGATCALAALGTMGSGFFAAAVVLLVLALQGWRDRDLGGTFRRSAPTLVVCLLLIALGALGRVPVNYHESLKAGSTADFLGYTLHCLQWPAADASWLAPILWLPATLLAWRVGRRRERESDTFPLVVLGLAAWAFLQILATAYTRGVGGGMPSSRYGDTLAFGLLANGLALAWLWPRLAAPLGLRTVLGLAWLLAAALPAYHQASVVFGRVYPDNRRHLEACEENVRRYLVTGDPAHLDNPDLPYPGKDALRERIDPPAIQAILPASVRPPLALGAAGTDGAFVAHSTVRRARTYTPPPGPLPPPFAALPALAQRTLWFGRDGTGYFLPLYFPRDAVLRFLVTGQGAPELAVSSAAARITLDVPRVAATGWNLAHVSVERGPFNLQAHAPAGSWLAFAEPVVMARGSYWAWRLGRTGRWLWPAAAGAALLAGLGSWYCARGEKALVSPGRSTGTPA